MNLYFNISKKCIDSKYVVGSYANDDSRIFSRQDGYVYYSLSGLEKQWGALSDAAIALSEEKLILLLEAAEKSPAVKKYGYKPVPLVIETYVSVVNSENFNIGVLERKKQTALSKLTEDDKEVLGLK